MSRVLEQATAHFRNKVGGEMKFIEVPEWSSKIWFKSKCHAQRAKQN
jgi:hypothetical protein